MDDLSEEELKQIENVDDTMLHYEFEALMDFQIFDAPPDKTTEPDFSLRDFIDVERKFLEIFNRLIKMI
ncbi:hypothetical protein DEAC_c43250 [Desulfosporosinus acididurans]|uniref:Uncharacterized protein n=1 Tax=Desulfosporosinus acididurans TaxID=476652 RepID=A0A0J1FK01_9FIRM|nr:hypothetical protein [Desulfosporosinus acididurans]KLU63757.1 hypothetical protein DEAC_c43250 [Desulfosporosinus acididurans]